MPYTYDAVYGVDSLTLSTRLLRFQIQGYHNVVTRLSLWCNKVDTTFCNLDFCMGYHQKRCLKWLISQGGVTPILTVLPSATAAKVKNFP